MEIDKQAACKIVEEGQRTFEAAEGKLIKAADALMQSAKVIEDAHKAGITGRMHMLKLTGRLYVSIGRIGETLADVAEIHEECTCTCESQEIDVPAPRSGGR